MSIVTCLIVSDVLLDHFEARDELLHHGSPGAW
jgi:hypothetical protein